MTTGDKEWPDRELLVKKKCSVRGQDLDGIIYIIYSERMLQAMEITKFKFSQAETIVTSLEEDIEEITMA